MSHFYRYNSYIYIIGVPRKRFNVGFNQFFNLFLRVFLFESVEHSDTVPPPLGMPLIIDRVLRIIVQILRNSL